MPRAPRVPHDYRARQAAEDGWPRQPRPARGGTEQAEATCGARRRLMAAAAVLLPRLQPFLALVRAQLTPGAALVEHVPR